MWLILIVLKLAAPHQAPPPSLDVGDTIHGEVTRSAAPIHTDLLDEQHPEADAVGVTFRIRVRQAGRFHIDLETFAFDPYLVLRDADGTALWEDDNGLMNKHARLVVDLEENVDYLVTACALGGEPGVFELRLGAGQPAPIPPLEQIRLELEDARARIEWQEQHFGDDDVRLIKSFDRLGFLLWRQQRSGEALPLMQRMLSLTSRHFGKQHSKFGYALFQVGAQFVSLSRWDDAIECFEESLAIRTKILGPEHADTAASLNSLAYTLGKLGRYEEARPLNERALKIREKSLGPRDQLTAESLNNLALTLRHLGQHAEAEPLLRRALAVCEQEFGPDHPRTGQTLGNLAGVLEVLGQSDVSLKMHRRSLEIFELKLGPDHPLTGLALGNIAGGLVNRGQNEEAHPLFERALKIQERSYGENHPWVAGSLTRLAYSFERLGEMGKSLALHQRSLSISERVLGIEHPETATLMQNLAKSLDVQGQYVQAVPYFEQALRSTASHLDSQFPTMPESERLRLLAVAEGPERFLNCLLKVEQFDARSALAACLAWKGKTTRFELAALQLKRQHTSAESRELLLEVRATTAELSSLVLLPASRQADDRLTRIASLQARLSSLLRELNRDLNLADILETPSLDEIQSAIPEDGVLLDFYVDQQIHVWVLKTDGDPQLVQLGDSSAVQSAAQDSFLRNGVLRGRPALSTAAKNATQYHDLIWAPLESLIGNASTVFVCPDGFLSKLPFGVLKGGNGEFLLEQHRFAYLSDATRILEGDGPSPDREGPLLAVGNVDFDRREAPSTKPEPRAAESRGRRPGLTWNALPSTGPETQALIDLRSNTMHWQGGSTRLEGRAATEESVAALMVGQRYIHLATHGFFEPEILKSLARDADEKRSGWEAGDEQIRPAGLPPGLVAGLVFAGANASVGAGPKNVVAQGLDGYLTATDITQLDLSACDLAVLSACQTSLGSARAGAGLMSVRRGFEVAGAKTVVSSMWAISDESTRRLMTRFYRNYWQAGMTKLDALQDAQLHLLKENRARFNGDGRPASWGAFVLTGDWE